MPRRPRTISFRRGAFTARASASCRTLRSRGSSTSSLMTSPGWMGGSVLDIAVSPLMVVNDLHFGGVRGFPVEAQAELLVDPDAVFSVELRQLFETVAGEGGEIVQRDRGVQQFQFDA